MWVGGWVGGCVQCERACLCVRVCAKEFIRYDGTQGELITLIA